MRPDDELVALLMVLVEQVCVTGEEGPLADWLATRYEELGESVTRRGNSLVVGTADPERDTVLLVGHIDVVPPTDADRVPRVDGDRIVGRGTSDMKSGLAVAMSCFEDRELRRGRFNLRLVCYAAEEGAHDDNELAAVLATVPDLADAKLAVVLEPTDLAVQLGCLGALNVEVTFVGQAAHSARPWLGENALHKAGGLLVELDGREPVPVTIDGLTYREVVSATMASTSQAARNVVPERFMVNLNYRFAPDKSTAEAEAVITGLVGERAEVVIVDRAPAAAPRRSHPLVEEFIAATGVSVEPKQAWTDVARFAAVGVPALNFGPGLTAQAHRRGEYVPVANLYRAREALAAFLRS